MGGASNRFFTLLSTTTSTTYPFPLHRFPSLLLRLSRRSKPPIFPSSSLSFLSHSHFLSSHSSSSSFHLPLNSSRHFYSHSHSSVSAAYPSSAESSPFPALHPWPEWSHLFNSVSASGYDGTNGQDEFTEAARDFPEDFMRAATVFLAFARARAGLLRLLSRRDLEVVVENGTPFLFRNGDDSARRMRLFLSQGDTHALDIDKAQTVDLMRFLLSYASNPLFSSEKNNIYNSEILESSVRTLLGEMSKLCYSSAPESNSIGPVQGHSLDNYGEPLRPSGKTIEMKRGDWICQRCNFMNFARNMKCLECEEARPKRQLTGGEWECPQCDFFNYGRNTVCLRCDCKRPGEVSLRSSKTSLSIGYDNVGDKNKADIDSRLAANEEKAQRWFSKISQLDSSSDMNSVVSDEDFPEIMPLRKGVNRFVVSTRKTPLERRLANAQYPKNLDNDSNHEGKDLQTGSGNKSLGTTANLTLNEILGRASISESNSTSTNPGQKVGTDSPSSISSSVGSEYGHPRGGDSSYAQFVPLPADTFSKPENLSMEESGNFLRNKNESGKSDSMQRSEKPPKQAGSRDEESDQADKSERWFKRVAELHDVTDLASAISDEDFPEIMPMRKGENRFVVSKKKDRSLTSPAYKRRTSTEQASNANYVPFVPFPPDYFAKNNTTQTDGTDLTNKTVHETTPTMIQDNPPDNLLDPRPGKLNSGHVQQMENEKSSMASWNPGSSGENLVDDKTGLMTDSVYGPPTGGNSALHFASSSTDNMDRLNSGSSGKANSNQTASLTGNSPQESNKQNIGQSWTGKSLEGSAVKEPDPLDMSEEAKAERWFKRVAQIKDISELSQIPDEDFPSIMPMRKGVNRFVVSKRKTPLERRLTSPQYRKNLPIVSSDPTKKNDSN
ncbi:zinc finger protein VAR3, chloroplastic [Prunus avium]|uniref:Zinc finger protein VAR3, chloroplastic n=1 Tax=Prunus avium TaxID=42229 RepID=A0A6P5RVA4_PRUAV|nr:zinc finger protein VAR3, chloroplastic [Prunus avium]